MGRFQPCPPAHRHAGRDAAFHGVLTGADGRHRALGIAVCLQVDPAHKALPHPAALLGALHINEAVHRAGQHVPGIIVHGRMDGADPCIHVILF